MSAAVTFPTVTVDDLQRIAAARFGIRALRPGQRALLEAVLAGQDALGILPTGSGKSLAYELSALVLDKPVVVVSPLIALVKDQRDHLARVRIDAAELDSTRGPESVRRTEREMRGGAHPILYVTPERLQRPECIAMLRETGVGLLAVDEAHCVAQWGHEFRPAYLAIAAARRALGMPPMLALTATATDETAQEIASALELRAPRVVRASVVRDNLAFTVERTVNELAKRTALVELAYDLERMGGSAIVYSATVKAADELFLWFAALRVPVARYHAKMSPKSREASRAMFMDGTVRLMVATKAFGMGIDKPDIRVVVHYHLPDSLESYVQEAGRAGRDGRPARCVLLYRLEDRRLQEFFIARKSPGRRAVAAVLEAGAGCAAEIADRSGVSARKVEAILAHRALLGGGDGDADADTLVRADQARRARDEKRLERMTHYAQRTDCRVRAIAEYFGERVDRDCGRCDACSVR